MIHRAIGRPVPVELTADARVTRRVRRLAATSLVALGLVWALARVSLGPPAPVEALLLSGWLLMPSTLVLSLRMPATRYLLVAPSVLVTTGLAAICITSLPSPPLAAAGWLAMTAGVGLGGVMGLWLWYRVLPVPSSLDDPGAPGRWALIGLHVALIVLGWLTASSMLVT